MEPPHLFRFGFVCVAAAAQPAGNGLWPDLVRSWERVEIGDLVVHHHPETPVRRTDGGGGSALLIGHAFGSRASASVDSVLGELLAAKTDDSFFNGLDELSGRFALLILKGSTQQAFHDPMGSRTLYYRSTGDLCIGSHAELVASAFGHGVRRDVQELLASEEYKSRSVKYLPGDLTLYEAVHGLAPNNYYDLVAGRTVRYWPRASRRATTFDEFAAALDDHFAALAAHLADGRAPILGVTGGIDTRTMIAAFSGQGLPFRGITWLRKKGGVDERELEVIRAVAAHVGVQHSYLELGRLDDAMKTVAAVAKRNAGGFGQPSRITAHLQRHLAEPGAVFVRGYGAEIIRGFYNLSTGASTAARAHPLRGRIRAWTRRHGLGSKRRPVALGGTDASELLTAYDSSMRMENPGAAHARTCLAAFEGFIERSNFDESLTGFGFDLSDLFYWEHRMGMWGSSKHNEMDPAARSIAGFNSRRVYEAAFGLDPHERLTKELLLGVIRRYDEALAGIPYL